MPSKVLVVDDQPDLLEGLGILLNENEIEVFIHDSVITLPLVVRRINPDLILQDLSMPALSGSAVFRLGRSRLPDDVPLVLFSGCAETDLARRAEELGAHGFISKSREPVEIIAHIRSWISHSQAVRTARKEIEFDEPRTAFAATD